MDYTQSNSYDTHAGTGHRMHEDAKAIPTVWSAKDANSLIWSLMEVISAAGLAPLQFDANNPATYQILRNAIPLLAPGRFIGLRVFRTTQVYVETPGTKAIDVLGVGGGGAGGGSGTTASNQVSVGAGGGGGGWFRKRLTSNFSGANMVIGAAGVGAPASNGGAGGTTSFGTYSASGGGGGSFGVQSVNTTTFPIGAGSPGAGAAADVWGSGMPGQYAMVAPSGQISGQGGASILGAGAPWIYISGIGQGAASPGAGGSGAAAPPSFGSNQAGGNGGAGIILVGEFS